MSKRIERLVKSEKSLIYVNIREQLRESIKGMLRGQKLPSERKLSDVFSVDRLTLRKAMSDLEAEGFIVRQQGRGTFIHREFHGTHESTSSPGVQRLIAVVPDMRLPSSHGMLDSILHQAARMDCRVEVRSATLDAHVEYDILHGMLNDSQATHILVTPIMENYRSEKYIQLLRQLIQNGKKLVLMDQEVLGLDMPLVMFDKFKLGYKGTEYLLSMGCRKIAFVSTNTFATAGTLSHQGYCQAMRDFGIPDDQLFEVNIPLANSARPAFEAVCKLFKDAISQCDALFTAHFSMTYGAYRALEKLELLDKVTLLGTDADFNPVMHDISYMSQSYEEIGREAVNLLLGMYDNKTDHPGKIMVQPRLTHAQPSPWYGYFE